MVDSGQSHGECATKVSAIEAHTDMGKENDRLVATAWKRNGCWIIQTMDQRLRTEFLQSPLLDNPVRVTTEVMRRMAYHVVPSRQDAEQWLRENTPTNTSLWGQDAGGASDLVRI